MKNNTALVKKACLILKFSGIVRPAAHPALGAPICHSRKFKAQRSQAFSSNAQMSVNVKISKYDTFAIPKDSHYRIGTVSISYFCLSLFSKYPIITSRGCLCLSRRGRRKEGQSARGQQTQFLPEGLAKEF